MDNAHPFACHELPVMSTRRQFSLDTGQFHVSSSCFFVCLLICLFVLKYQVNFSRLCLSYIDRYHFFFGIVNLFLEPLNSIHTRLYPRYIYMFRLRDLKKN